MRSKLYDDVEKAKAWSHLATTVKEYSDEMTRKWSQEIDTHLVFAGLLSAILTAFNVQSYQLLQPPAPAVDPVLGALQQISAQLSSFSINPQFMNSTHPPFQQTDSTATSSLPPQTSAIWLNALWFSSLVTSLSSASLGIMVKQWLNEYNSGISSGTSREAARIRQYRLNNLKKWRVAEVVTMIPILLQLSLALFLAGLLVLLWSLHHAVAAPATALIILLALWTFGTILLPIFKTGCAYVSPQALALYSLLKHVNHQVSALRHRIVSHLHHLSAASVEDSSIDSTSPSGGLARNLEQQFDVL
ncbi:hypothetical protein BD414DRAFT_422167 [Trametes punicea]|nr:hypothetical protein BD414DRAFT_422167 [Trametes punicea]